MALMSFAEYARHRGVSKPAVSYAVRDGRISTTTDHNGKRVIDSEVADREWDQNTAHDKRRNTADSIGGAPTGPAPLPPKPEPPAAGAPMAPTGAQVAFDNAALGLVEKEKPKTAVDGADNTYARARADKEFYLAKQAELDFRKSAGDLIEVGAVKKEWATIAATVRTRLLGVPSKARQRIPDLSTENYVILERLIREALEELAIEGQAPAEPQKETG